MFFPPDLNQEGMLAFTVPGLRAKYISTRMHSDLTTGFEEGRVSAEPSRNQTDYLRKDILTPAGLTDIIENYAQIVERRAFISWTWFASC